MPDSRPSFDGRLVWFNSLCPPGDLPIYDIKISPYAASPKEAVLRSPLKRELKRKPSAKPNRNRRENK
jgi:hypothetical protein